MLFSSIWKFVLLFIKFISIRIVQVDCAGGRGGAIAAKGIVILCSIVKSILFHFPNQLFVIHNVMLFTVEQEYQANNMEHMIQTKMMTVVHCQ